LKNLHKSDLVFGDLGSANVLVTDQVDFDWCGKAGEGEYPAEINLVGIEWPGGVAPGGLLQLEHDNQMLRRLGLREQRDRLDTSSGSILEKGIRENQSSFFLDAPSPWLVGRGNASGTDDCRPGR